MDHRLKALIEVRSLLEAEGWAPDEADGEPPAVAPLKTPSLRPNLILVVVCLSAVATNFILIGANHDLRASKTARLSVQYVHSEAAAARGIKNPEQFGYFLTIDGEWAWGAEPGRDVSTNQILEKSKNPLIQVDGRCALEVWHKVSGDNFPLGQARVVLNSYKNSYVEEVRIPIYEEFSDDTVKQTDRLIVSLKIDRNL